MEEEIKINIMYVLFNLGLSLIIGFVGIFVGVERNTLLIIQIMCFLINFRSDILTYHIKRGKK